LSFADFEKRIRKNTGLSKLEFAEVYAIFSRFPLSGVMTRSSSFIHFGSLQEFSAACLAASRKGLKPFYSLPEEELIPEVEQRRIVYNSGTLEAEGSLLFAENCDGVRVVSEGPLMIAGVRDWVPGEPLPGGLCIEQRSVGGRRVMVVFGIGDDFGRSLSLHDLHYCGVPMPRWLNERNLDAADLWDSGTTRDLSSARLFACDGSEDLVRGLWRKLDDGVEWAVRFRSARRYSISELDSESSATERDQARVVLRTRALRERLLSGRGFRSISAIDFSAAVTNVTNLSSLKSMFNHTDDPLLRSYRQRLLAKADPNFGRTEERISIDFARGRQTTKPLEIRVKHDQIVWARCPVRLDLAGGWSDTPPYTNRFGGEVLNVAVDLNGQSPIQVFVRRTRERFIKLHSIDLGVTETIADTRILQDYRDPSSPFSLPKAVLCLFGLDAAGAGGLDASLGALGGGLELTLLCAVPKGSGLGTSSILAGTILAALARFFGMTVTKDELFLQVLEVEQMLTTGGGWQDQIGGMIGGVKFSESRPGLWPSPLVYQLDPFLFENDQYRSTMTLFYTGITRLAKNILQEVVERVNELSRSYLFTHHCIKELARFGREAISLRDLGRLARVISMSWQENVLIHESTTNQEIEAMVSRTSSYFRGMKLLGAGGGGFALFVSESPAHADELRQVLRRDFENDRARLVDFQLNKTGLEVTVS
jgi:galactokinase/mevalonate kinase-like predicted kinase